MLPLPPDFLTSAKTFAGDEYERFIESLGSQPPVSLRLNPFKLPNEFAASEKIGWSVNGRYLSKRPSFTLDPFFHAGCYYVQDASSQFLEIPFRKAKEILRRPLLVLDLCAAPGGKSTHMLSMLDEDDFLVSNEIIPSRNNVLRQNIIKWGCANSIVTQNDPEQLSKLKNIFDVIVVDAPCSGEGLFRKDPEAIEEWSPENVRRCAIRQNQILDHSSQLLKPDGILIYCTCTFEESENDLQVERMIKDFGFTPVNIENEYTGIVGTKHGLAFFPHRVKGEGFYISMLRNNSDEREFTIKKEKNTDKNSGYSQFVKNASSFTFFSNAEQVYAIPSVHFSTYNHLRTNTYVRLAGIHLGELKGKDFIPSEQLALSNFYNHVYPEVNISIEEAVQFLKGNPVNIHAENGFVLIKYENFGLGWVKKINQRVNNYYPKEWRIRF